MIAAADSSSLAEGSAGAGGRGRSKLKAIRAPASSTVSSEARSMRGASPEKANVHHSSLE